MRGRVREVVIYFKLHENRSRGLGAEGGRQSPSPIDKAHGLYNSLYYRTSRDIARRKETKSKIHRSAGITLTTAADACKLKINVHNNDKKQPM